MSSNTLKLTDDNFDREVLASNSPVVVDFWAPWCGPCRILTPLVEELATDFAGRAKVAKLNIDDYPYWATQYDIRSIPTLVFFQNGQVVDRVVGVAPKEVLAEKLHTLLQRNDLTTEQVA